jgi:hypothetical protein
VHVPAAALALIFGASILALMKWLPTNPGRKAAE